MTKDEWIAEGKLRFGDDTLQWRFVCPSCGHIASVKDWREANAPDGAIAFSCVGRYANGDDSKTFNKNGGPCQYAGGGLFRLNPVQVIDEDGQKQDVFAFAP